MRLRRLPSDAGVSRRRQGQLASRGIDTDDELFKEASDPAAGDSFNGAYLAARAAGAEPRRAAVIGNAVAEQVVLSSGAIIGQDQMPVLAR
jgi:hypothetical protein